MDISFADIRTLLLLAPVLGGTLFLWRLSLRGSGDLRSRAILALRMMLLTLLVMAIAAPSIRYIVDRQAVVFIADLSASMDKQRQQLETFIRQAIQERGATDLVGIVAVGRRALVEWPMSEREGFREFQSAVDPNYTNLAEGLRLAGALLPQDARKRIVVLSDGQQNLGDALEQASFLRARGVQVDVVPLEGPSTPEVLVSSVKAPSSARTGERVSVEVTVRSTRTAKATLRMHINGALVATREVLLEAGEKRFAFDVVMDNPGFHTLQVTVDSEADTRYQNNRADAFINVQGPPMVLVIEDRVGAGKNISDALSAAGLQVERRPASLFPDSLEDLERYSGIVLVDVPADSLGQRRMEIVRAAVRDLSKGLLVIGGGHSFTMGEYRGTSLEEVLPVISEVPERQERGKVALVLVMDKSGSMASPGSDGIPKVEMAKEAARLSLQELENYDLAGVVAFDASNWWLVPLREIGDETHLKEMQKVIGTLIASGGTDIYPALVTAYQALVEAQAPRKHIILLTDGNSQPGDYLGLLRAMQGQEITLSTIAIGLDADTRLLRWLAEQGEGRFYFTDRSQDIPRILVKETRLAARHAIVEEPTMPLVAGSSPVLRATEGKFPMLGGYVMTLPKNAARVVLASPKGDPLLAQWQYGLGRSIAWTSDSEGRWTSALVSWERAPAFWSALVNWLLPPEEAPFQIRSEVKGGIATLLVEGDVPEEAKLWARIVGPKLNAFEVPLKAVAPGRWEADFPAEEQGSYLVQVAEETPQGGRRSAAGGLVVPYSPEFRDLEAHPELLKRLAAITGGRVLASPSESFSPGLPPAYGGVSLRWWLLMAAILLLPLDITFRRLNVCLAEVAVWLAAAREALWLRRRLQQPAPTLPVLGSLRRHRAGRARVGLGGAAREPSYEAAPAFRAQPAEQQQVATRKREQPETSGFATERWLQAKRRAGRR